MHQSAALTPPAPFYSITQAHRERRKLNLNFAAIKKDYRPSPKEPSRVLVPKVCLCA